MKRKETRKKDIHCECSEKRRYSHYVVHRIQWVSVIVLQITVWQINGQKLTIRTLKGSMANKINSR